MGLAEEVSCPLPRMSRNSAHTTHGIKSKSVSYCSCSNLGSAQDDVANLRPMWRPQRPGSGCLPTWKREGKGGRGGLAGVSRHLDRRSFNSANM